MHSATIFPFPKAAAWPSSPELSAIVGTSLALNPRYGVEVLSSDDGPVVYVGLISGGDDAFDAEDSYCLSKGPSWITLGDLKRPHDAPTRFPSLTAALEAMREHYAAR